MPFVRVLRSYLAEEGYAILWLNVGEPFHWQAACIESASRRDKADFFNRSVIDSKQYVDDGIDGVLLVGSIQIVSRVFQSIFIAASIFHL